MVDDELMTFSYFSQKIVFAMSCKGDNLHEMAKTIFCEK